MSGYRVNTHLIVGVNECDKCLENCRGFVKERPPEKAEANWYMCVESCLTGFADDYQYCIDRPNRFPQDVCDYYKCPVDPKLK